MDIATMHFWGKTKYWWALIITGILMIPCGLWLWFQPALGYEVLSLLLGWLLILFGIVQLIVSGNVKQKVRGWGWWLAGGIIDILIGFILVGNLSFSEAVLPFFFAFIFMYKGIANLFSALNMVSTHRYWWLYLVNGLLLLILGLLFFASPFTAAVLYYFFVCGCLYLLGFFSYFLRLFFETRGTIGEKELFGRFQSALHKGALFV